MWLQWLHIATFELLFKYDTEWKLNADNRGCMLSLLLIRIAHNTYRPMDNWVYGYICMSFFCLARVTKKVSLAINFARYHSLSLSLADRVGGQGLSVNENSRDNIFTPGGVPNYLLNWGLTVIAGTLTSIGFGPATSASQFRWSADSTIVRHGMNILNIYLYNLWFSGTADDAPEVSGSSPVPLRSIPNKPSAKRYKHEPDFFGWQLGI